MNSIPFIGLEVHVELATKSKMFCGCQNDPFHAPKPNIYTCPVCLGLPGALPVPNRKAVEWTIMLAKALGCQINEYSKFDRKHYFYPDLPKGYQISQYDQPIGIDGNIYIGTSILKPENRVRIRRVHLEEDTGKLHHRSLNGEKLTLIDFNRSGVPLVEIVTEPDIHNPDNADSASRVIYYQVKDRLQISDADMEKGQMRLEANVSISTNGQLPDYKVEIKNINSFRFLRQAIESELKRQMNMLRQGVPVKQETRGWDSVRKVTKPQRTKEEAADYRYFPEPDIPPMRFTADYLKNIAERLPPDLRPAIRRLELPPALQNFVISHPDLMDLFMALSQQVKDRVEYLKIGNWLQHHSRLWQLDAQELVAQYQVDKSRAVSDEGQIRSWINEVISEQKKAVSEYRGGKREVLEFLIGQVQRKAGGKAKVPVTRAIMLELLS